ncbi:hypothetical protein ACIRLA_22300 [Streptomyces sp. NPDC102364]|uniref:hypothetical protein n=1 Tax=Streptomyces sp. NPDC102364 TaxID=3366161 RepID=UPI00380A5BD9
MSILNGIRGTGTRRAVDKVGELRDENKRLLTAYHAAGDEIALLRNDLTTARHRQAEAEEIVVKQQADLIDLVEERDQLLNEVRQLRAELANRDAVTVQPMERDTSDGADQATAPIDVRPLREAAADGLLSPIVRISMSGASASPGQPPAA